MPIALPTQFVSTNDLIPTRNALSTMFAFINPKTGALPESGPPLSELERLFFYHATPQAILSQELLQRIKSCGIGMASPWASQQFIRTNPVTGWFLTHCGFGGINEALVGGVPLICWPFAGDQSISAVHLTYNLNIAFNLMETPIRREEAERDARLSLGGCLRGVGERAGRRGGGMRGVWGGSGSSEEAIQAFLREYGSRAQLD
ncbi:hypothetical protein R3P38DRAFT_3449885 [Favolaschia claudopus]|uniref:Uncharacterized protein n=1 Tax=Favolaschia claudopus TaxID=2862362 RepID=A0AAV9ZMW0_9AGAR